ncbi:hypothetical protein HHK36_018335 [Tetracentron sinense]|uniref:Malectin-like domain-containing protein n=1 Tax=Tetracentron sinense TaxID=13715 RepID=A0A835DA84_TETSI|nr:hypothetical protein HHK36_018335 [Tetracentron sinense]
MQIISFRMPKSNSLLIKEALSLSPLPPYLSGLNLLMANHLMLLFLALFTLSVSAEVFVNLDCGSSDIYTDENSLIWYGDDSYIQNGESKTVQASSSIPHVLSTLRVFSTRKKNCYSFDAGTGGKVLVRASFYYGNYDKKSSPPTFDLQFDGNYWATVVTSSDQAVYYEAIYDIKGQSLSVCLAQTKPDQLPFISTLEVRSLDSGMYGHADPNSALLLTRRVAFGTNDTVRSPDDTYDRIWVPAVVGNGLMKVESDNLIMVVNVADYPPEAVLLSAITSTSSNASVVLGTNLPTQKVPIYMNMYFAEMSQLDSTEKRSFEIYIDGKSISDPIIPPYGSVLEMYITNVTASSNTSVSLVATSDSTLPPLINAMEVFSVYDALTDGTNSKDVEALASLQSNFPILQEWSGDPCLPSPFTWDWVACSTDQTPRITALYLGGFGLSGLLPDFSSMDSIQTIDMHNNSLNGEIPDFLGTFSNLKELNLADNDLSGSIPSSLSKNNKLKLVVSGNPSLCVSGKSCKTTTDTGTSTTPSGSSKKSSKLPVILGTIIPSFAIFWVIVGILATLHHKRKTAAIAAMSAGQMGGPGKPSGPPQATPTGFNVQMAGKIGEAIINEFRVDMTQQTGSDIPNSTDQQTYQGDNQIT